MIRLISLMLMIMSLAAFGLNGPADGKESGNGDSGFEAAETAPDDEIQIVAEPTEAPAADRTPEPAAEPTAAPEPTAGPSSGGTSTQGGENETSMMTDF